MAKRSPFRYFKTSPEIIRLAVMLHVRFPLSLRNAEDLPHARGIDVSHETECPCFQLLDCCEPRKDFAVEAKSWRRCAIHRHFLPLYAVSRMSTFLAVNHTLSDVIFHSLGKSLFGEVDTQYDQHSSPNIDASFKGLWVELAKV